MTGTPYIHYNIPNDNDVCQDFETSGTDFWVTFGGNVTRTATAAELLLELKISSPVAANVTLEFTADNSRYSFSTTANSQTSINLAKVVGNNDKRSNVYELSSAGASKSRKSLHITSSQPISVYACNIAQNVSDITNVLPVDAWGTDYYRFDNATDINKIFNCYNTDMIIAREATTLTTPDGTVNLNAGDVWYYSSAAEMTGRHITSNKPIAYFSHNTYASVPSGRRYQDILFQQMMSVDRWGKTYLVPNAQQGNNTMNNLIRIVAAEDGTVVNFTGASHNEGKNITSGGILNEGEWVELLISSNTGACFINANKAVGVCSYLVGDGNSSSTYYLGDPAIAWIPALNQSIKSTIVAPFYPAATATNQTKLNEASAVHAIIIITKKDTKTTTKINGVSVASGWTDNGDYAYYRKVFDNSTDKNKIFKIENTNGIIVLGYGISNIESYYYNAGSGACVIN
ncbi:hypothetical protein FACS1894153_4300 [Bacteroidia bacterium]|nr:hypothetical protein FACS1894153_4300 [Bacteroidia bacterium]